MKKFLILFCALLLFLPAACGRNGSPDLSTPETSAEASAGISTSGSSDAATSASFESGATTPESSDTGTVPDESKTLPTGTNSRQTNPPANSTNPPANSTAPPDNTTPSQPPATSKPPEDPPKPPVYTEADYNAIIAEIKAYAENRTSIKFIWSDLLTMDNAGYHGLPNLTRHSRDSVIKTLKYHVDLTVEFATDPKYGVPSESGHYRIIWFVDTHNVWGFGNGDILFAFLYG